jgi:hypothetical protein
MRDRIDGTTLAQPPGKTNLKIPPPIFLMTLAVGWDAGKNLASRRF